MLRNVTKKSWTSTAEMFGDCIDQQAHDWYGSPSITIIGSLAEIRDRKGMQWYLMLQPLTRLLYVHALNYAPRNPSTYYVVRGIFTLSPFIAEEATVEYLLLWLASNDWCERRAEGRKLTKLLTWEHGRRWWVMETWSRVFSKLSPFSFRGLISGALINVTRLAIIR